MAPRVPWLLLPALLLLALPAMAPPPVGPLTMPPPLVAWARLPDVGFACAGAGVGQVLELGPDGCHVLCVTESYCAVFARDAQLAYVPFLLTYQDILGRWLTADSRDYGGYICVGIGNLWQPSLLVTPLPGPAQGIANAQDDDGLFC